MSPVEEMMLAAERPANVCISEAALAEFESTAIAPRGVFTIQSREQYLSASEELAQVKARRKRIADEFKEPKENANQLHKWVMKLFHHFDDPAAARQEELAKAIGDYQLAEQGRAEEEQKRQQELARQEAMKAQREREMQALELEMLDAGEAFACAVNRNQGQTAKEIEAALKAVPAEPANPAVAANTLRQAVAFALEREARRVRVEEAKRAGDIEAARKIAHEKIEVNVSPVHVEPVEIAPVVVEPEIPKVDGQHFRTDYVPVIEDEEKVPREFCSPDPKKLKAFATAFQGKREIPGVRIEKKLTPVQRMK